MILRRPKKRVRMHLKNDTSVEGVLIGRRGGHYELHVPQIVTSDGTHEIDCAWLEVPAENVVFYEVKSA